MTSARRERKVVTVLFADLVDFTSQAETLDPEDVEAILRPYHERLRSELERFGGTVEKFIGDAAMALFGAPVAHDDHPQRAVRAALAIRDWARDQEDMQVRIAANTGEVPISLDARPASGEGMAAGDVVDTAARMQSAAPTNGIVVGEATYRATRRAIDYRKAGTIDAKGKSLPVAVWEVVEARARVGEEAVSTRTPLVGRDRELAVLRELLVRVREESSPQLATLVGVPGIGKSRLVRELMEVVEQSGVLTFWRQGRSLPYGEGVTFWALAEMVKAQAAVLETDSDQVSDQKLAAAVAELIAESAEVKSLEEQLRPLVGAGGDVALTDESRAEAFAAWRHSSRRWPSSAPSSSSSRTSTGPTTVSLPSSPPRGVVGTGADADRVHRPPRAPRDAPELGRREAERHRALALSALGLRDGPSAGGRVSHVRCSRPTTRES